MLSVFLSILLKTRASEIDDSFIRVVTDKSWPEQLKKSKNCFLMFHASHQRVSDTGYLRYVEVAENYKNSSIFYVISGAFGDSTARQFRIGGFPSLFHVSLDGGVREMYGPFSVDNIDRFIRECSEKPFDDLELSPTITKSEMLSHAFRDEYETESTVFLFSDESTRFGRVSVQFAKENSQRFRFFRIKSSLIAEKFGIRYPSIHLFRLDDHLEFTFSGEPSVKSINEWISSIPSPRFSEFDPKSLFSIDGNLIQSKLFLINQTIQSQVNTDPYSSIRSESSIESEIRYFYTDPDNISPFLRQLNIPKDTSSVCIQANYTHLYYGICSQNSFDVGKPPINTPPELYDGVAIVTEHSFYNMLNHGPLFTIFSAPNCDRCNDLHQASIGAFFSLKDHSKRWCILQNHITLKEKIGFNVPSLYYIRDSNFSNAIEYKGQREIDQVLSWASAISEPSNDYDSL